MVSNQIEKSFRENSAVLILKRYQNFKVNTDQSLTKIAQNSFSPKTLIKTARILFYLMEKPGRLFIFFKTVYSKCN